MRSEAAILQLIETGLFLDAARAIDATAVPTTTLRVARAGLEIDVGSPSNALDQSQQLIRERLTHAERSACWETIARVELSTGHIDSGLKAMHNAFASARATQDPRIEARLIVANSENLLNWVGIEAAAAEIPRMRQAAISTSDSYGLISFHSLVAELKAKKGFLVSAKRSISTARNLLERWPNVWQQGRLAIKSAVIHSLESDYQLALDLVTEALRCGQQSGSRRIRLQALGNLAHIKLALGQYDEAREAITEYLSVVGPGAISEIAGRDTEMQVALASGDLSLATELARRLQEISLNLGASSYPGLWHVLTRVKWLYRIGEVEAGLALALEAIPEVERKADRNLLDRLQLLAAEGLSRVGRTMEAVSFMARTVSDDRDYPLEITAEAMRVTGRISASTDQSAAMEHFERAAKVFAAVGNVPCLDEVAKDALESLDKCLQTTDLVKFERASNGWSGHGERGIRPAVASLTERIAAVIEFASLPPLLAREVLSLIIDSGTVSDATIVVTQDAPRHEQTATHGGHTDPLTAGEVSGNIRIDMGTHRDCLYEVVASPLRDAPARATLLAIQRLAQSALAASRARLLERERADLWPEPTPEQQLGLICASERMRELVSTIRRVAASNVTVLLTGETGVGKELFARALHQASTRHDRVFLPFNCATVARDMFDSQLFGHRRGSFTGAIDDSQGVIRSASGGTLLLDEIGEMSLETQPKLLRFLESGEIRPLGDAKPHVVDVRLVAATNANLDQLVAEGRFREDLYYRLNVIRINIPPLRERREEVPALVEHFLERYGRELQKPNLRVADETLEYLVLYRWPGNVRQLANEIRRMVALAEPGAVLMPAHLSDDIVASRKTIPTERPALHLTEVVTRLDQPLTAAVEHVERAAIQRAVAAAEGNLIEAARMLGLSRKGLYLKRQRLGIE